MPKLHFKIMVVEDELLLLEAISKKLELAGFDVQPFTNGHQALEALHAGDRPDAIWLDYYLRDMTGQDFMQAFHQTGLDAAIPVTIVSNSATAEQVRQMLDLGANQYLLKTDHQLQDVVKILAGSIKTVNQSSGGTPHV